MSRVNLPLLISLVLCAGLAVVGVAGEKATSYKVTGTAIEACSCPLFCSCYYNEEPTGGHMCRFNMAYKVEPGSHWGNVDLSGAKFWITGDLGGHFGDGETEWVVITFDKKTTAAQRDALNGWLGKLFPVKWKKASVGEDSVTWEDGPQKAHAKLASGKAEITLHKVLDKNGKPAMATNTAYWGANSNTGFRLAHSTHYYKGEPSFEFKNRNGFMITVTSEGTISSDK